MKPFRSSPLDKLQTSWANVSFVSEERIVATYVIILILGTYEKLSFLVGTDRFYGFA